MIIMQFGKDWFIALLPKRSVPFLRFACLMSNRLWLKLRSFNGEDMSKDLGRPLLEEDSGLQTGYGKSTSSEPEPKPASPAAAGGARGVDFSPV